VRARLTRFSPAGNRRLTTLIAALDSDRYLALLAAVDRLLADPPLTRLARGDGNWELPGGRIEVGGSAVQAVIHRALRRLQRPHTGSPRPDGTAHQQLAPCFHAVPATAHDAE
jgi:hypothetical protein